MIAARERSIGARALAPDLKIDPSFSALNPTAD